MSDDAALVIESASRDDVASIVALLADDFLGATRDTADAQHMHRYFAAFDEIAASANNMLCVARRDGGVVGCFQLTFIPGLSYGGRPRAQIESVRTRAGMRGQGIGAAMMAFAIEKARARGCCLVQLSTNNERHDAHRFYERLGFQATHRGMKLLLG